MAEIFAIVGGSLTLAGQLMQVGQFLHEATKRVQHAREDIAHLANESITFAGLYDTFRETCDGELELVDASLATQRLTIWTEDIIDELNRILEKVNTLRLDNNNKRSITGVLVAHLEWFFKRSAVERLRASLSVARDTINGFCIMIVLRKLDTELNMLNNALLDNEKRQVIESKLKVKLEVKINKLKQEIYKKELMHKATERILETAKERLKKVQPRNTDPSSQVDELWAFTESIEDCADSVIAKKARKRTRSTRSPMESHLTQYISHVKHGSASITSREAPHRNHPSKPHPSYIGMGVKKEESPTERVATSINVQPVKYVQRNEAAATFFREIGKHALMTWDGHTWKASIGRHAVTIGKRYFTFNRHVFEMENRETALSFYYALRRNHDVLDAFNDALDGGCDEEYEWLGIPGWSITIRRWSTGVNDLHLFRQNETAKGRQ